MVPHPAEPGMRYKEFVALRWKDVPKAYWDTYKLAWFANGTEPQRFNGGAGSNFADYYPGVQESMVWVVAEAVDLTPVDPAWGEVCL